MVTEPIVHCQLELLQASSLQPVCANTIALAYMQAAAFTLCTGFCRAVVPPSAVNTAVAVQVVPLH